jgi:GNAT superfamily N-acetyltransferase
MDGPSGVAIRPAATDDMAAAFAVFRRSLQPMLHRLGSVPTPDLTDAEVEQSWPSRAAWIEHVWRTSAENWVAVSEADGSIIGWAISVQRGPLIELTHFFVLPEMQAKGIGHALFERVMPPGRGPHRAIVATQDPRAMRRYLRSGVRFITSIIDLAAMPRRVTPNTDLEFDRLDASAAAIDLVGQVEEQLVGHRRDVDIEFLLGVRPAWIARRGGAPAAFAFGHDSDELTGPIGALDAGDIPALLDQVENHAAEDGAPNISFSTTLANHTAVQHLLQRGYAIDPFFASFLADSDWLKVDRWIHTGSSYIF